VTEADAVEEMYAQWQAGWDAKHPGSSTPIDITQALCIPWTARNETFTPDKLGPLGQWARITVKHFTRTQTTQGPVGSRMFEVRGAIFAQLFGPLDQGARPLALTAGDVRDVLEGVRVTTELVTYEGTTRELDDDGAWCMSTVTVPFRYTEQR
jgi:hypothetical protein